MSSKRRHIPGDVRELTEENKRLRAENLRLRAERDAAVACNDFAEEHVHELETRLAVSEDVRQAAR